MKRLSTALGAAGLLALAACGSTATSNNLAANTSNDTYDVAPDDLTANDLTANDLMGNEAGNATDANASANADASGNTQ